MKSNNAFLDNILQNRALSHVLFWLAFLFIFTILNILHYGTVMPVTFNNLAMLPSQIIAAYFLNYYQIPKLLYKRKYLLFAVSIVLSIYILSAFARFNIVHIIEPFVRENFEQESIREILTDYIYLFSVYFPAVYIYAFMMLTAKAIKNRFEEKHQIEVLEKEKATNELKFLKAQIQPHFLFNTLNNLYALTLAKSDLAPQVVLKLSELLDFILYQSNESTIAISKEIELIQSFIELESLRYEKTLDVIFNHGVDNKNTQIAPLLLLSSIENAFKHGLSSDPKNAKIHIDLSVIDNTLKFKVFNNKINSSLKKQDANKSGIGNTNLKRQLELNYPQKHDLEIQDASNSYTVKLDINLI